MGVLMMTTSMCLMDRLCRASQGRERGIWGWYGIIFYVPCSKGVYECSLLCVIIVD